MSKLKCEDCGDELKDTRVLETQDPPGVRFVAHCENPECHRKWEWVNVTRQLVGNI